MIKNWEIEKKLDEHMAMICKLSEAQAELEKKIRELIVLNKGRHR